MSALSPSELVLANLIHDLRQPLGNIESSLWCLRSALDSADPRVQQQTAIMERQVEAAERLLAQAAAELQLIQSQRTPAGDSFEVTNSAS